VLDIEKDENFSLSLLPQLGYAPNECITTLTYSAAKGIIAAGTDKGNVAMWKFRQNKVNPNEPEACWNLMNSKSIQAQPIKKIRVNKNEMNKIYVITHTHTHTLKSNMYHIIIKNRLLNDLVWN
jgi:hypothetical protein